MSPSDAASGRGFAPAVRALRGAFDSLSSRRVILIGGKGGAGKTTIAALAAMHFAGSHDVTLFTTDPASNLDDLFAGDRPSARIVIESIDGDRLYREFLDANIDRIMELGDRGTYLEREEIRTFLELALPGIDELMAWKRIGDLAVAGDRLLVVDTAPTGHTLRMLASGTHFERFAAALEAMQAKHHVLVEQFTRVSFRDKIDEFLASFEAEAQRTLALLRDTERTAFVPVFLPEPWVVAQTARLSSEVRSLGIHVPFAIVNRASHDCDCRRCLERAAAADRAAASHGAATFRAPDACGPLASTAALRDYLEGRRPRSVTSPTPPPAAGPLRIGRGPRTPHLVLFAGKGGVGKTTSACSVALQLAERHPDAAFVLLSVDPAHSVRDVFARFEPPANLSVETIDTRAQWESFRGSIAREIERAIDALTPGGLSLQHDQQVIERLLEMAPPGADEIFAVMRIAELARDGAIDTVIVDTAPTGHFLRLLELPRTAGAWVREFMRLLLRYKDLIPPGTLGEKLLEASRDLREFSAAAEASDVVVVARAEGIVLAETSRLIGTLRERGLHAGQVIVNYLTPESECACDRQRRAAENGVVSDFFRALAAPKPSLVAIGRRETPPVTRDDLRNIVPLEETGPS